MKEQEGFGLGRAPRWGKKLEGLLLRMEGDWGEAAANIVDEMRGRKRAVCPWRSRAESWVLFGEKGVKEGRVSSKSACWVFVS